MNQNYGNHKRMDPKFHYVLSLLTLLLLIGSIVYLTTSPGTGSHLFTGLLFLLLALIAAILFLLVRTYALKAQDRAIRAEEQLRHYVLTGRLHDSRLSLKQIIALRFAGDDEFVELAHRAAEQQMRPDDIKKAIQHWKADHERI